MPRSHAASLRRSAALEDEEEDDVEESSWAGEFGGEGELWAAAAAAAAEAAAEAEAEAEAAGEVTTSSESESDSESEEPPASRMLACWSREGEETRAAETTAADDVDDPRTGEGEDK